MKADTVSMSTPSLDETPDLRHSQLYQVDSRQVTPRDLLHSKRKSDAKDGKKSPKSYLKGMVKEREQS